MVVDVPVEIKWCSRHGRWEWKDPLNKWGGLAYELKSLKRTLARLYKCPNCASDGAAWPYHVLYVTVNGELLDFGDFISEA